MLLFADILLILFVHWIADFLLQTEKMALNKSKSNYWLVLHVMVYSLTWIPFLLILHDFEKIAMFIQITFLTHFCVDYFTSRWTSYLYAKRKFRAFFMIIGLDQLIHYTQLTWCYLNIFQ